MQPTTVVPIIPFLGSYAQPLPHCSLRQVRRLLMGLDLSPFRGDNGSLDEFDAMLVEDIIPEASARAVRVMRTNFDYSREIWYFNGPGSTDLVLPRKAIIYVNAVFLRILPSLVWYRFVRIRNVDGAEFAAIGGIEPPPALPENLLPYGDANTPYYTPQILTGAEDADLFISPRRRTLSIPPRVLAANIATPFWDWTFMPGNMNVEVHFAYGYAPTMYTDRQPLQFDPLTGDLLMESAPIGDGTDVPGGAPVDWSSGMPRDLTQAVARMAYADVLRRFSRGVAGGLTSVSVDGASESYDAKSSDANGEEERALAALAPFTIRML